jgi:hypothetical protein
VARKRYEVWVKEAAIHGAMLKSLNDTNTMNKQGYSLVRTLGGVGKVRRRKHVLFEGMTFPFIPPRLLSITEKPIPERVAVREEKQARIKDREVALSKGFSNQTGVSLLGRGSGRGSGRGRDRGGGNGNGNGSDYYNDGTSSQQMFMVGYQQFSTSKKVGMSVRTMCGLAVKTGQSIKNVLGNR